MKIQRSYKIVETVNPDSMAGSTLLERVLNSFITRSFIGLSELPADECLDEAKWIIALDKAWNYGNPHTMYLDILLRYLSNQFYTEYKTMASDLLCNQAAAKIMDLLGSWQGLSPGFSGLTDLT